MTGKRTGTGRKLVRRSLYGLGALAVVLAAAAGGGYLWLRGSLPQTAGTIAIAALHAPVEVLRDADGIVTIRAKSERDAAVALGYVHAQDRLWQMDFMRRSGAGRLSEVLGEPTRRLDRFLRTLGLYRTAEANLAHVSPELRALLDAYAAGVNAFIADPGGPLPPEFQLLRYAPEPWRPADSLVWGRLMALELSGNWREELLRARLARRLTPEQIAFLWPGYPAGAPTAIRRLTALEPTALRRLAAVLPWRLAPKDASNAWVLAGSLTASGRPVLANDPHLALTAPGVWYLARIETPDGVLAGATAPGVPFLIAGRNARIAWGFTTTHSDTQDLFVERLVDGHPELYETPDGPRPFATREETIAVRGAEPERFTLRTSRHGPVLSDALPAGDAAVPENSVLALAWPALAPDDRTAEALYRINRAQDWDEFRAALKDFHSPQQNIVYADTGGTIGFVAPARVPIRKRGDGRAPVPGWSGAYDWSGYIPFDDLPMERNPPDGRVVTANNKVVPDGYRYLLTADWPEPYRAERILQLLDDEAPDTTPGAYAAGAAADMQQDVASLPARELLPLLLAIQPTTDRGREAVALLRDWDGTMDRDSAAPLVYYAWLRALDRALLADELGDDFADFEHPKAELLLRILREGTVWCDDVTTAPTEDCKTEIAASLESALNELALRFGRPAYRLRWGEAHQARFHHPVLSRIPLFDRIFGYAVETPGGDYTVNRAGVRLAGSDDGLFEDIHGPGYRAVYDLADLDNSRFMIATGQSGNPLSPHYGDLAVRWRDGHYVKLVGDATVGARRLRLTPAP